MAGFQINLKICRTFGKFPDTLKMEGFQKT